MTAPSSPLNGLLVIDKPSGMTSHDVVARVRRLTGTRRTGHAGTLDPMATGVLPLGLGQGTRVLEYLVGAGKAYRATVRLGVSTDTYDAEGAITATAPVDSIDEPAVERALRPFHGRIQQRPPRFSALKRDGRPLYAYARAGIAVEVEPRTVLIEDLRLLRCELPDLELAIVCGSGFYVRSLAHDLGQALGCGAHLTTLIRTRVGPFSLADAAPLAQVEERCRERRLHDLLLALDAPLRRQPAVILSDAHGVDITNGKRLLLPPEAVQRAGSCCRAYSATGEFIAVLGAAGEDELRPLKVFPAGQRGPSGELPTDPLVLSS